MKSNQTELSLSDDWATEDWLFAYLSRLYGPFTVDVAAAAWNAKCPRYLTKKQNALKNVHLWSSNRDGRFFLNPPYSKGNKEAFSWRARCLVEAGKAALGCLVLPHDTGDGYWTRCIEAPSGRYLGVSKHWSELGTVTQTVFEGLTVEKTEIRGRVGFRHESGKTGTARQMHAIVVFARTGLLRPLVQPSARGAA